MRTKDEKFIVTLTRAERAAGMIAIRGYVELLRGQLDSRKREINKCEAVYRKLQDTQPERTAE